MSAASRVISAAGGLLLLLLVLSLFLVPAVQTLADSDDVDFPGGRWGVLIMLLGMASVPGTGAVLLFRRAVRGDRQLRTTDTESSASPARGADARTVAEDVRAAAASPLVTSSIAPAAAASGPTTHSGDQASAWTRRIAPAVRNLFTTSLGRGVLTALIGVPLMVVRRDAAPAIGPMALTIFSIVDPLPMAGRPSWWLNAFVSGTVWFVLSLVLAGSTDIVSDQPDIMLGFFLPMMAYPAMMAVSALIRFTGWWVGWGEERRGKSR